MRRFANQSRLLGRPLLLHSHAVFSTCVGGVRRGQRQHHIDGICWTVRRHASSSTNNQGPSTDDGFSAEDRAFAQSCKWQSSIFPERLGFTQGESMSEEELRRRYRVLARFYHPDAHTAAGVDATAFQNIKEAYEVLLSNTKSQTSGGADGAPHFHFSDEARRRAQIRAMGDGVITFLFLTCFFIFVVMRHNKERLEARYLSHFIGIFFVIQLFPRLLSAAILFAWHAGSLVSIAELRERASVTCLVEKQPRHYVVQLIGIKDAANTITTVEMMHGTGQPSTTTTYPRGTTSFDVPRPTSASTPVTCRISAKDEHRRFLVAEHTVELP